MRLFAIPYKLASTAAPNYRYFIHYYGWILCFGCAWFGSITESIMIHYPRDLAIPVELHCHTGVDCSK